MGLICRTEYAKQDLSVNKQWPQSCLAGVVTDLSVRELKGGYTPSHISFLPCVLWHRMSYAMSLGSHQHHVKAHDQPSFQGQTVTPETSLPIAQLFTSTQHFRK